MYNTFTTMASIYLECVCTYWRYATELLSIPYTLAKKYFFPFHSLNRDYHWNCYASVTWKRFRKCIAPGLSQARGRGVTCPQFLADQLTLYHSDSGCWNSFGNWFWHLIVGNMSIVLHFYQERPFFALKNHPRP